MQNLISKYLRLEGDFSVTYLIGKLLHIHLKNQGANCIFLKFKIKSFSGAHIR